MKYHKVRYFSPFERGVQISCHKIMIKKLNAIKTTKKSVQCQSFFDKPVYYVAADYYVF